MAQPTTLAFAYIEEFRCLADRCPDNCCHDWRVAIDEQRARLYQHSYPPLYDIIAKDEAGYHMNRVKAECPALDDGLCAIHRDYSEALLPDTCMNYPRMYRAFDSFQTKAGTLSCPEVARKCLTDARPFALVDSVLPDHHQQGHGLTQQQAHGLDACHWQQLQAALIDQILASERSLPEVLQRLALQVEAMEQQPVTQWRMLLDSSVEWQPASSADAACSSTLLLTVLLEQLDQPATPESMRQGVLNAFDVLPTQGQPEFCLQPRYQHYYAQFSKAMDQRLQRYTAAEITRTGFPLLSSTSAGQDYGLSLREWFHTLVIRVTSLRLLVVINSCNSDATALATDEQWVEWVYQFSRKVNHQPVGACELALRLELNEQGFTRLATCLDFASL
ncbi:hypothetical protein WH50_03520 [Pokkaliibacter plantistimulans]|uniref:Lysine-N-methylase n=1 Tax=Pokkaliibacter plantistimulans TaxID=1635171 RepID=A0ABX5M4E7_9GAMM|nr:flagellin lysine-N-methylase [Pokkaliibacter plantistimulans]PXF32588.1 hypothetical protein WH50_03520 [Pokkaliibacter plantistimulans]